MAEYITKHGKKINGGFYKAITFKHTDNKIYTFKTEPNNLGGSQMWWYEPEVGMYAGTVRDAKNIIKNIKEKTEVIEETK